VIAAEVALGAVLVIGSGLLLASLYNVMSVPRGFDGCDVLTVDFALPSPAYRPIEKQAAFFRSVREGLLSIPGVIHVAAHKRLPLTVDNPFVVVAEDLPRSQYELPATTWASVSSEYFAVMRIPLRAGRLFRAGGESEKVAIVSESAARSIWPGQDPIGKRVKTPTDAEDDFSRVIGVAGDVLSAGLDRAPVRAIYRPY
jgi:putative ABC transport system permease protein